MRAFLLGCLLMLPVVVDAGDRYVRIPAGEFVTTLRYEDVRNASRVHAFEMMVRPVSNADYLAFVLGHPQWRRDRVARVLAGKGYLAHWQAPTELATAQRSQPVTNVSWFAAAAYCEARGARLPRWIEWEYVAAADATRRDARGDRAWRDRILGAQASVAPRSMLPVGASSNVYGVRDLHGGVWEWVDDHSALLLSGDNRTQGDPDRAQFCGAGGLSVADRAQYAVLMRIALLSSLEAGDSTSNLGFRCVREVP